MDAVFCLESCGDDLFLNLAIDADGDLLVNAVESRIDQWVLL